MPVSLRRNSLSAWKSPLAGCELIAALEAMLVGLSQEEAVLELALVDDAEMAALNQTYLGCLGPTNVLAFPAVALGGAGRKGLWPLGWLAISVDTLFREALLYGQDPPEYALRLLAHGLAHLLGYTHGSDMDKAGDKAVAAAMWRLAGTGWSR